MKNSKISRISSVFVILAVLVPLQATAGFLDKALRQIPSALVTAEAVKSRVPATQNAAQGEVRVTQDERATLLSWIQEFDTATRQSASTFEQLLLFVTLGSIVLGLGASIAGFLKKAAAAGILSIVGAGILSTGNVLPIAATADFYRLLSAQASALHADAALSPTMTASKYGALKSALQALIEAEGKQFPGRANAQKQAEEVLGQLLRAASGTAEN